MPRVFMNQSKYVHKTRNHTEIEPYVFDKHFVPFHAGKFLPDSTADSGRHHNATSATILLSLQSIDVESL